MSVTAKDIQNLRKETGFGVMECKKALMDSDGDFEKAKKALAKKGALKAEKRAERETNQGIVESYLHGSNVGAMIVLGCETDFVAKNNEFKTLAHDIAMQIASMDPKDIDDLMKQSFIKDPSLTIKDLINEKIGKIGENIKIVDFKRMSL